MTRSREHGVTLLELMVVIVIIGIMATVAIPSYRSYLLRAQRTDATGALLRIAAAQEKFYLQNNRYATEAERASAPPAGLGIPATEHGYYQLAIDNDDTSLDFTATATVIGGGAQDKDAACRAFTINQAGARTATNSADASNTAQCWR